MKGGGGGGSRGPPPSPGLPLQIFSPVHFWGNGFPSFYKMLTLDPSPLKFFSGSAPALAVCT